MLNQKNEDGIIIATLDDGITNTITQEALDTLDTIIKNVNENDEHQGPGHHRRGKDLLLGVRPPHVPRIQGPGRGGRLLQKGGGDIHQPVHVPQTGHLRAWNGAAIAGGFIISMAADYRIVKNHPKIKLGMNEIKIGLGLSIVQTEVVRFGLDSDRKFRDVMYFGEMYDVQKAKEIGIVDEIVEEDQLIATGQAAGLPVDRQPGTRLHAPEILHAEAVRGPDAPAPEGRELAAAFQHHVRQAARGSSWSSARRCSIPRDAGEVDQPRIRSSPPSRGPKNGLTFGKKADDSSSDTVCRVASRARFAAPRQGRQP